MLNLRDLVICISLAAATNVVAEQYIQFPDGHRVMAHDAVINMPTPEYPNDARKHGWRGAGVFTLHIDLRGGVTFVEIKKSTGYAVLDKSAVAALTQWRFKRGVAGPRLDIPITFTGQSSARRNP